MSSPEIVPLHPPSITLHMHTLNAATYKKVYTTKDYLSLLVYLYLTEL